VAAEQQRGSLALRGETGAWVLRPAADVMAITMVEEEFCVLWSAVILAWLLSAGIRRAIES
jgi:hypothetical protein